MCGEEHDSHNVRSAAGAQPRRRRYPAAALSGGRRARPSARLVTSVLTRRLVTLSRPSPDSASVTRAASPGAAAVGGARPDGRGAGRPGRDDLGDVSDHVGLRAQVGPGQGGAVRVSGSSSVPRTRTRVTGRGHRPHGLGPVGRRVAEPVRIRAAQGREPGPQGRGRNGVSSTGTPGTST